MMTLTILRQPSVPPALMSQPADFVFQFCCIKLCFVQSPIWLLWSFSKFLLCHMTLEVVEHFARSISEPFSPVPSNDIISTYESDQSEEFSSTINLSHGNELCSRICINPLLICHKLATHHEVTHSWLRRNSVEFCCILQSDFCPDLKDGRCCRCQEAKGEVIDLVPKLMWS